MNVSHEYITSLARSDQPYPEAPHHEKSCLESNESHPVGLGRLSLNVQNLTAGQLASIHAYARQA